MIEYIDWGSIAYSQAYDQQKTLFERAIEMKQTGGRVMNKMLFCEHPHVITVGKHGLYSNLLYPENALKEKGVELYQTDRGGDITYHGPGQVVGYPIFDLESFAIGLKEYIHRMEEVIIRTVGEFGIPSTRLAGATGVWLEIDSPRARKIAAIGVRCSRYVTMHGFALNVNTDLDYFRLINPCGFVDKGVTSMKAELGEAVDMAKVKERITYHFNDLFK